MESIINWIANVIAAIILLLADYAFGLVLLIVGILGTIIVVIGGFLWIPLTVLAVVLMFALKSGIAIRFVGKENGPLSAAIYLAIVATGLSAVGSFGFLALTMQDNDIRAAFFRTYGIFPEVGALSTYGSFTEKVYVEHLAPLLRYVKMWGYLMLRDGLPFFVATVCLLCSQQRKAGPWALTVVMDFAVCILGILMFALIIYGDDLLDQLAHMDLPAFVGHLVSRVREEARSAYDLVMIPFGGSRYATFDAWFHDELVKMAGSVFKMMSIYPKFFIVFFLFSLIPHRATS